MIFEELSAYQKDLKKLLKKHKTLLDDMTVVKSVLTVKPNERPPFSFRINNLNTKTCVVKVKKIASKSFKGKGVNSGFRIVYTYFEFEKKIVLVELYHKSQQEIENRERILTNFE